MAPDLPTKEADKCTLHVVAMCAHVQGLIIFQEGLAEVDVDCVSWVDVFEVVPLL